MELNRLQYISQGEDDADQLKNIQTVLDAGGLWIQLRFKNKTFAEVMNLAEKVRLMCNEYKSIMIVNDHVAVAASCEADGVHLGLNDGLISDARSILGHSKIIGGTANTATDVEQRIGEDCDYVGLGPMRFTSTKAKLSPLLGISGYKNVLERIGFESKIPIFAIGGVDIGDVPELLSIGVYGVAVSGKIDFLKDPQLSIKKWNECLNLNSNFL